jgi:hypothetical protein
MPIGLTVGLDGIQDGNRVNDLSVIARAKDRVIPFLSEIIFTFLCARVAVAVSIMRTRYSVC